MEYAIVLTVMTVPVLGLIEISTALRATTIRQSSVRKAGRLASMDCRDVVEEGKMPNETVERDIRHAVTASKLPDDHPIVSIQHAEGNSEGADFDSSRDNNELHPMFIEVELPYAGISLFSVRDMGGNNLTGGASRKQRN